MDQPRDAHGRFSSVSGTNGIVAAHQKRVEAIMQRMGDASYTVDPHTGKHPQEGYMVGGGGRYVGGWTDPRTGKRYVERSTRVSPGHEALAKSLGRMRNQISIWDLKRHREIRTGGTGD